MKRGWIWLGLVLCVLVATACAGAPKPQPVPKVETVTVTVPGPLRSCVPTNVPPQPVTPDTDETLRGAPGAEDRYQMVIAGRALLRAWLAIVTPVLEGCK